MNKVTIYITRNQAKKLVELCDNHWSTDWDEALKLKWTIEHLVSVYYREHQTALEAAQDELEIVEMRLGWAVDASDISNIVRHSERIGQLKEKIAQLKSQQ